MGNNSSVAGGFAQNFFQIQNVSKIPRAKKRIISRGDEQRLREYQLERIEAIFEKDTRTHFSLISSRDKKKKEGR